MNPRERLDTALNFNEPDRPPHFECQFQLVKEAFGADFPEWEEFEKATPKELDKLYHISAELYAKTVERYKWDGLVLWRPGQTSNIQYNFIPILKSYVGDSFPIFGSVWSSFICIETVYDYMEFSIRLIDDREGLHAWAKDMLKGAEIHTKRLIDKGVYGINIAADSAFNSGTFLSPHDFKEFTAEYMVQLIDYTRSQGVKSIFHTDGNLMEIMDTIIDMKPDILQSIDPMAGMDIAKVKEITYGKISLMGNVQCSYLQDGQDGDIYKSTKYCLDHAFSGGGYIFSSSNVIFKGMPLANYEKYLRYFWNYFEGRQANDIR